MTIDREHLPIIQAFIDQLAERSAAFAFQAGVSGMETAGHLISYLAENPRDLEPFLNGGFFELTDRWIEHGVLSHRALNGKIVHPAFVRHARIIKQMEKQG